MNTRAYIDGFNLYYGALRNGGGLKWLDLEALCSRLCPKDNVDRVLYFTARIAPSPWDANKHVRQQVYLRALQTQPKVEVIEGQYVKRKKPARLYAPPHQKVQILHVEEKGSDVNLATYLLMDGFLGQYDKAIVISNDSDLTEAVRIVRDVLHKEIIVVNPHQPNHRSMKLSGAASGVRQIRQHVLRKCQLPKTLTDATGQFTKPTSW
jgi:uncharacterized LabA/DUF88 family protein